MYQSKGNLVALQVAPMQYPISDRLRQGGAERVVYLLEKELTKIGVTSVVACSDGSHIPSGKLRTFGRSLSKKYGDVATAYQTHEEEYESYFDAVVNYAVELEPSILHDHTGWFLLSKAYERRKKQISFPILTTLAPHDSPENYAIYNERKKEEPVHFCVVSHSQKSLFLPYLDVDDVVYNGIDIAEFPFEEMENKKGYLFSLGRITWCKGQHIAIAVAKKSNRKLAVGGAIVDTDCFEQMRSSIDSVISVNQSKQNVGSPRNVIDNLINSQIKVMYIGQLNDLEKREWYKFASCFLMPILWEEPFGLVMVEAMACGTPVVAFNRGAVPEIVQNGKTGFIVETEQEMVEATRTVGLLDSHTCRAWVADNFTSLRMAQRYLKLYTRLIEDYRSWSRQLREGTLVH